MTLYRIYIDEVGNEGMKKSRIQHSGNRYLSLTGVILEAAYYTEEFYPALFRFKAKYIPGYPDNPVGKSYCLHRKDILNKQKGFEFLHDDKKRVLFSNELLTLVREINYLVISVVLDKSAHLETYGSFHYHPYHCCLEIILERYVRFLENRSSRGDVMIEARDKNKDKELKSVYAKFYKSGTNQIQADRLQSVLTSNSIKIKPKEKNIYGLQLADVVAYPSFAGIKSQKLKQELSTNYGGKIFHILSEEKYHRIGSRIWGIGKTWLP